MARALFDVERPTVGLLNVGVEEIKGQEEVKEAGKVLREVNLKSLDYKGFVEGDDIAKGTVDVVVTEGFGAKTLVREKNWVYIPPYPGAALFGDKAVESGNSSVPQLYDLAADIGQRTNLAAAQPERVEAMSRLLESIRRR